MAIVGSTVQRSTVQLFHRFQIELRPVLGYDDDDDIPTEL